MNCVHLQRPREIRANGKQSKEIQIQDGETELPIHKIQDRPRKLTSDVEVTYCEPDDSYAVAERSGMVRGVEKIEIWIQMIHMLWRSVQIQVGISGYGSGRGED
jgi:hypothetical protein